MKYIITIILLGVMSFTFLFAEDTLRYKSKELFVDTTYFLNREYEGISSEKIKITNSERASSTGTTDILNRKSGLYVRDYGGYGGIKTVSFRGTYSSQNVILLNGMRLSSSQNSNFDLSLIPISVISSIELAKGGVSAIHGSNGIGGALDIKTNANQDNRVSLNYSSFNSYGTDLSLGTEYRNNIFRINYIRNYSQGEFPFEFQTSNSQIDTNRRNADFLQDLFLLSYNYNNDNINIKNNIIVSVSDRGVPGAVLRNNINNPKARLSNEDLILNSSIEFYNKKDIYSINSLIKLSDMNYKDPDAINFGVDENYLTTDLDLNMNFEKVMYNSYLKLKLDINYDNLKSDVDELNQDFYILALNSFYSRNISSDFSISSALRLEQNSFQFNYSPAVNLNYDAGIFQSKISYSYNFRTPNFNELYFPYFGNNELDSETSHSLNLNLSKKINDKVKFHLDLFYIDTKDLIVARPVRPNVWSVVNVESADNKGIEANITLDYFLNLEMNISYQQAVDRSREEGQNAIPYTPEILSNIIASKEIYGFTLNVNYSHVGLRYALPSKIIISEMDYYNLLDFALSKELRINSNKIFVSAQLRNVLNEQYEVINNFPMPGMNFRTFISFIF